MKAYGEAWQYSVFYCALKAIDRVRLENAARESATVLGISLPDRDGGTVVI